MLFNLIYPDVPTEVIDGEADDRLSEMLPIVDESGNVSGQASRSVCHSKGYMHPVVHLHIIDRMSNVYLQHRSLNKDLMPGRWDTAVGGHISYGEYVEEALYREAGEELGFFDFNPVLLDKYVFDNGSDKELVCVFATVGHFDIKPDNYEVQEGRYWSIHDIERAYGKDILTPQFESEFKKIKEKLLALL